MGLNVAEQLSTGSAPVSTSCIHKTRKYSDIDIKIMRWVLMFYFNYKTILLSAFPII